MSTQIIAQMARLKRPPNVIPKIEKKITVHQQQVVTNKNEWFKIRHQIDIEAEQRSRVEKHIQLRESQLKSKIVQQAQQQPVMPEFSIADLMPEVTLTKAQTVLLTARNLPTISSKQVTALIIPPAITIIPDHSPTNITAAFKKLQSVNWLNLIPNRINLKQTQNTKRWNASVLKQPQLKQTIIEVQNDIQNKEVVTVQSQTLEDLVKLVMADKDFKMNFE
ncbi:Hypothetical_protein [Hexamita inflata]|uniref:Hypothetical_protein n=1 Tax=Hexamita inflata TaxID=28002 RepID=A0AA86N682_9EUKA|nr:Hypothetical protein HINF_LOCUS1407 [Hexamita inflata]